MIPSTTTAARAVAVTRGVRLGYGVGSFCTATFSAIPGLLLLFYMTNILAVPAWLGGLVVFAPKAWDLIINPLVGQWSDRTVSRWGPRRPWLLGGAVILPIAFALTFIGPPLTGTPAALYVGLFFLIAATGYALYEVPFKAMPAEMTDDYHERTSLLQWRMIFVALAIGLSGIIAPAIAAHSLDGYRTMGFVFAGILFLSMIASFFGTARAPLTGVIEPEASLRTQLAAARASRPFMWLLGLSSAQMLAAGVMLAGAPYFASYTLKNPDATSTLFAALIGPMLITMPLWVWIARKMDKRGAMVLAGALFLTGALMSSLTPFFGSLYAHLMTLIIGVGYAGLQLLQFSMLADVISHESALSGKRRGGVLTGLWTAVESAVAAFGALVVGGVLAVGGFLPSDPEHPVTQPDSALTAVVVAQALIPAVIILIGILMTLKYRLTAEQLAKAANPEPTSPVSEAS
ncbi:MFS transporter [Sphaerisporangium corydalis]|uniref:MFS transporter n=1 Tax=Sphaerisporangium corydalis TaxID=1441875 RepID=A0ABV9EJ89_9ACTN|nr:MFS transporter [Sphaerisporangium corydalis]